MILILLLLLLRPLTVTVSALSPAYYIPVSVFLETEGKAITVLNTAASVTWRRTKSPKESINDTNLHSYPPPLTFWKWMSAQFIRWVFPRSSSFLYPRHTTLVYHSRNNNFSYIQNERLEKQKYDSTLYTNNQTSHPDSSSSHPPLQSHSGWIPYDFPNPQLQPDSCGVSKLNHNDGYNHTDDSYNHDRKSWEYHDLHPTTTNSVSSSSSSSSGLLLCDPDSLLDTVYLQRIADALQNFSYYYGSISNSNQNYQNNNQRETSKLQQEEQEQPYKMIYFLPSSNPKTQVSLHWLPPVEIGIAMTHKMDIASILRSNGYYSFEDAEGMINDAAQIFASVLLDQWWKQLNSHHVVGDSSSTSRNNPTQDNNNNNQVTTSGVLIFLSLQDRVCFISASADISDILPWWRLDHVVTHMKTNLQTGEIGLALLHAITGISHMLDLGPPSIQEKIHDFCSRFGFVLSFALFTFLFAMLGEVRDRQRKLYRADVRSRLTQTEKLEAKKLQQEYKTSSCPICLDSFEIEPEDGLKRVDSFGIPILGNDGLPLKLLRCGHIMDTTCWLNWVKTGHGASLKCPVCREDLGGHSHRKGSRNTCTNTSLVLQETDPLTPSTRPSRTYGSLSQNTS